MTDDIVTELREAEERDTDPWDVTLYARSAAEIEALRAENARMAESLGNALRLLAERRFGSASAADSVAPEADRG